MSKKIEILNTAYKLAEDKGFNFITRDLVAELSGVAMGTVNYYFNTIEELRDEVMIKAIKLKNSRIIAEGIVTKNQVALESELAIMTSSLADVLEQLLRLREENKELRGKTESLKGCSMTALQMQHLISTRIIQESKRQLDLRDSLPKGSEERRQESLILEGLLRAASIATTSWHHNPHNS